MISYQVLQGDSYDILHRLSENPEQRGKYKIIVTSPPYFFIDIMVVIYMNQSREDCCDIYIKISENIHNM